MKVDQINGNIKKENCSSDFLNDGQYQSNGILRYEKVFGHTFVSTGGLETTKVLTMIDINYSIDNYKLNFLQEFTSGLKLKPGMKVLDIGCGTGGSAFYLARTFGVEVLGLDLSQNMLDIANKHLAGMEKKVQDLVTFRYLDATLAAFPKGTFDLLYSRDAIMHIAEKEQLYSKVFVSKYLA